MTRAETLTPVLPQRFAPSELEAAARWVGDRARRAVSSPARLVATFRALDAILARAPDVIALRAEFIDSERDMVQIEADDGARLIVHAIEVRALVMAAAKVQLIDAG